MVPFVVVVQAFLIVLQALRHKHRIHRDILDILNVPKVIDKPWWWPMLTRCISLKGPRIDNRINSLHSWVTTYCKGVDLLFSSLIYEETL
ncbi:MAG: hypothetical protein EXX96DRAFT_559598 [Benjaminiella poitrasii]|nr:MAG: hypothetical protein EXX96DRAFT_559598 [Benjaminiella poitrasii]